jgi:hypothetical protein
MNDHNATPLAVYKIANPINLKSSGEPNDPDIPILILPKILIGDREEMTCVLSLKQPIYGGLGKWKEGALQAAAKEAIKLETT